LTAKRLNLRSTEPTDEEAFMRKMNIGWTMILAVTLAVPALSVAHAKSSKAVKADDSTAAAAPLSKEDQDKLKEHNKLRAEIKKVKYPAAKADVVAHVKGIKADDKKWFEQTLPDKTFASADEVYTALGWETAPAADAAPDHASKTTTSTTTSKTTGSTATNTTK
jgi:hypothetical protein